MVLSLVYKVFHFKIPSDYILASSFFMSKTSKFSSRPCTFSSSSALFFLHDFTSFFPCTWNACSSISVFTTNSTICEHPPLRSSSHMVPGHQPPTHSTTIDRRVGSLFTLRTPPLVKPMLFRAENMHRETQ